MDEGENMLMEMQELEIQIQDLQFDINANKNKIKGLIKEYNSKRLAYNSYYRNKPGLSNYAYSVPIGIQKILNMY